MNVLPLQVKHAIVLYEQNGGTDGCVYCAPDVAENLRGTSLDLAGYPIVVGMEVPKGKFYIAQREAMSNAEGEALEPFTYAMIEDALRELGFNPKHLHA